MWTVYKHTTPNGKVYIGITLQKPEKRWGNGNNYKGNNYFYHAIQKYGWQNITHEIVCSCRTKDEACEEEKRLISEYKATDREYGYNLTDGGEHYEFAPSVIEKMKKPKRLTEAQRKAISERAKVTYEKYLKGRPHTPAQIQKMAETKRGKKQSKEMIEKRMFAWRKTYELSGGFTEEHREKIRAALIGRTYTEESIQRMKEAKSPDKNPRSKRVLQIKDDVVICEFCSAREAMRQTGIQYSSIVRVCNGTRLKHAGGYEWRYANEQVPQIKAI